MKTLRLLLALMFLAAGVFAQVRVPGPLTNGGNSYAVTRADLVSGAPQVVATMTALSNTPSWLRTEGQEFHVVSTDENYRLVGGTNNANLTLLSAGGIPAVTATNAAMTVVTYSNLAAAHLTGALPAIDGSALTGVSASASNVVVYRGYSRQLSNAFTRINVKDFGAVGNWWTDDTVALQTCLDMATNGIGEIFIPAGIYGISNTLRIPTVGQSTTNKIVIRGDGSAHTRIMARTGYLTNANLIESVSLDGGDPILNTKVHFEMTGLQLVGPLYQTYGGTNYASWSQIPFRGAVMFLGKTGAWQAEGNFFNGVNVNLEDVYMRGGYVGLCVSNVDGLNMIQCKVNDNAWRACVFSHLDTLWLQGGNYGSPFLTNYNGSAAEIPWTFDLCGTGYPATYNADSGVHKFIVGIEHEGPFMYADSARVTVMGGQCETFYSPLTNGWCHLTNEGTYTFIGTTIHMPSNTNTFLFHLGRRASAGLKIFNCSIATDFDDGDGSVNPRWFDIYASADDAKFYPPFWVEGAAPSGQTTTAWKNARWNGTNYVHVKPNWWDVAYLDASNIVSGTIDAARLGGVGGAGITNQFTTNVVGQTVVGAVNFAQLAADAFSFTSSSVSNLNVTNFFTGQTNKVLATDANGALIPWTTNLANGSGLPLTGLAQAVQPASENLTNWSALGTNAIGAAAADTNNLTFWEDWSASTTSNLWTHPNWTLYAGYGDTNQIYTTNGHLYFTEAADGSLRHYLDRSNHFVVTKAELTITNWDTGHGASASYCKYPTIHVSDREAIHGGRVHVSFYPYGLALTYYTNDTGIFNGTGGLVVFNNNAPVWTNGISTIGVERIAPNAYKVYRDQNWWVWRCDAMTNLLTPHWVTLQPMDSNTNRTDMGWVSFRCSGEPVAGNMPLPGTYTYDTAHYPFSLTNFVPVQPYLDGASALTSNSWWIATNSGAGTANQFTTNVVGQTVVGAVNFAQLAADAFTFTSSTGSTMSVTNFYTGQTNKVLATDANGALIPWTTNLANGSGLPLTGLAQGVQPASENLTNWSALATSAKLNSTAADTTAWSGPTNTVTVSFPWTDYTLYPVVSDCEITNIVGWASGKRLRASLQFTNATTSNCVFRVPAAWKLYGATFAATNSFTLTNGGKMFSLDVVAGAVTNGYGAYNQ